MLTKKDIACYRREIAKANKLVDKLSDFDGTSFVLVTEDVPSLLGRALKRFAWHDGIGDHITAIKNVLAAYSDLLDFAEDYLDEIEIKPTKKPKKPKKGM